jgi:hypothetical protein
MSTANIVKIVPVEIGVIVTFQTHRGEEISYLYDPVSGDEILNGADPAEFSGVRLSGSD